VLRKFLKIIFLTPLYLSSNCDFQTANYINELRDVKQLNEIVITIPKSTRWAKNQIKAVISKEDLIEPKYKKRFKAEIKVNYSFGSCIFDGKVRISGDWKDHISFKNGNPVSSLDIHLSNGNIFNATKFKLFLPETRYGIYEVIASEIFSRLGYLSPKTFLAEVEVNTLKHQYIFQEKSAKEMLERNNRREGPIFEADESILWGYKDFAPLELDDISLARMINTNWVEKGSVSSSISLSAFIELQKKYIKYSNRELFISQLLGEEFNHFSILLIAMSGDHSLNRHNRKLYFNSFEQKFEPIYYDGNFDLKNRRRDSLAPYFLENVDQKFFLTTIKKLENIKDDNDFFNSVLYLNENNSKQKIIEFIDFTISNLKIISSLSPKKINNTTFKDDLSNFKDRVESSGYLGKYLFVDQQSSKPVFYEINHDGSKEFIRIDLNNISDLLGENLYSNQRYTLITERETPISFNNKTLKKISLLDGEIIFSSNSNIEIDLNQKKIRFFQSNPSDWALFKDISFDGWSIYLVGKKRDVRDIDEQRFNVYGLTGCINFYNSIFLDSRIFANEGGCEDSVNLVSSKGIISKLAVQNSFSDAIDLDMSEIEFKYIEVLGAVNDCLDLSTGNYVISEVFAENCGDKGISVGEGSTVNIDKLFVSNSVTGISSKDLSDTKVNSFSGRNTQICTSAFQKKQEFGGGFLRIENSNCNGVKEIDSSSVISIKNEF
tara:strand:+ start:729 stop:2885 length:2157 start_codon:yes stop_codon:yes gene_type:complete